jgi:hypothetical protein
MATPAWLLKSGSRRSDTNHPSAVLSSTLSKEQQAKVEATQQGR